MGVRPSELLAHDWITGDSGRPGCCEELSPRSPDPCTPAISGMVAFEAESGQCNLPALAFGTETHRVGNPHVVEEHFVERSTATHLLDRTDLDARKIHRNDERCHALVLDDIRVRPGNQFTPRRELGSRAPHLLAIDDPLVTVTLSSTSKRRKVTSSARFGEELATQIARGEETTDEGFFLLGRTEDIDRGSNQPNCHAESFMSRRESELRFEFRERPRIFTR